jgi:hypothetical protein
LCGEDSWVNRGRRSNSSGKFPCIAAHHSTAEAYTLQPIGGLVLYAAVLINVIVITGRAGVRIPRWLFVSVSIVVMMAIHLCAEWAQRRLARGLEPADERASEQSLFDMLPAWVIVLGVAAAVSLALYFGRAWPLKGTLTLKAVA